MPLVVYSPAGVLVVKAHDKFKKALAGFHKKPNKATRKGLTKAIEGLGKALDKYEKKMRDFVGF